jgi:hypothetical protein
MNVDDTKEIFWKSDLDVTLYYLTFEEVQQIPVSDSEYLASYFTASETDLTEKYKGVSVGRGVIFYGASILKLTVEALSPEYGRYVFSELPLKDAQRSNLGDGCFWYSIGQKYFYCY